MKRLKNPRVFNLKVDISGTNYEDVLTAISDILDWLVDRDDRTLSEETGDNISRTFISPSTLYEAKLQKYIQ